MGIDKRSAPDLKSEGAGKDLRNGAEKPIEIHLSKSAIELIEDQIERDDTG